MAARRTAATRALSEKEKLERAAKRETAKAAEAEQTNIINAVLVHRLETDGNLSVDVQTVGDVRVTEAATILKLGLKLLNDRLGVD